MMGFDEFRWMVGSSAGSKDDVQRLRAVFSFLLWSFLDLLPWLLVGAAVWFLESSVL